MDPNQGLLGKYIVTKTSGEPVDPEAVYFVLRVDTDPHARAAVRAYIRSLVAAGTPGKLAYDLTQLLAKCDGPQQGLLTGDARQADVGAIDRQ